MEIVNCIECTANKKDLYSDAIRCMLSALEYRDPYTKGHSIRVGELAVFLSNELNMPQLYITQIQIAGQLHDIGKIAVPDQILLKPGKLSEEEWKEIKKHPSIGADIISESSQLQDLTSMIAQHHERWDGNGYPYGLSHDTIDLGGRILALCDSLDAMGTSRSYRSSLSWNFIENELITNMGTQFDPQFKTFVPSLIHFWQTNYEKSENILKETTMYINNLKEQHTKIYSVITETQNLVNNDDFQSHGTAIAKNISQLAGILKIHLGNEDRNLYPTMMKSDVTNAKTFAEKYNKEMGNLSIEYIDFKNRFNTFSKIMAATTLFNVEFEKIIKKLLTRLNNEDQVLYPLAESL